MFRVLFIVAGLAFSAHADSSQVIVHLRGVSGVPLLAQEPLVHPASRQRSARAVSELVKQSKLPRQLALPVLPACEKSGTRRKPRNGTGKAFDLLFLEKSKLQLAGDSVPEMGDLFGGQAQLYDYNPQRGGVLGRKAIQYGAKCLPFRLRVTDKYLFRHYGKDALLNYDLEPNGKGQLHPVMERLARRLM